MKTEFNIAVIKILGMWAGSFAVMHYIFGEFFVSPPNFISKSQFSILGASSFLTFLIYFFSEIIKKRREEKLAYMRMISDVEDIFFSQASMSNTVRVFVSGGEKAKNLFIKLVGRRKLDHRLEVKVLMRGEGQDVNRLGIVKNQSETWIKDVDRKSQQTKGVITTKIKVYNGNMSFYGFIFDDRCALLSWYSRGSHRTSPDIPHVLVYSDNDQGKSIISESTSSFDDHFRTGGLP